MHYFPIKYFAYNLLSNSSSFGSKTLLSFSELALGLEKTIKRMVLEIFGVEKYMDELVDSTDYSLRLIKYKGHADPIVSK